MSTNKNKEYIVVGTGKPYKSNPLAYLLAIAALLVIAGLIFRANNNSSNNPTNGNTQVVVQPSAVQPAVVTITGSGFTPGTISIQANQAVIWYNSDSATHQVASDPYPLDNTLPGLNSRGPLDTGSSYSYVFSAPGTYTYHDNLNPDLHGTVIVK